MYKISKFKISLLFVALTAALICLSLAGAAPAAFAVEGSADTFEVVFPVANYFQSQSPTTVAANESYLTVLDLPEKRLYVRGSDNSTYFFDISDILTTGAARGADEEAQSEKAVAGVYVVKDNAFIALGVPPELELYSLDLRDRAAAFERKEISNPQHIYCFASDGKNLYAKNAEGYVAIFNEDLSVVKDDIYNYDVLPGKASVAAEDGKLYLFSTDDKNVAQLCVFDCDSNEILLQTPSKFVQKAYIGDVIYAQISPSEDIENHSKIICLDKETGEELYTSNFMPESFCAYGDKLYSIGGGSVTGYRFIRGEEGCKLEPEETISMAGSDFMHLNRPKDALILGDTAFVADSENLRLAAIDLTDSSLPMTSYVLEGKPVALAGESGRIYALLEDGDVCGFDYADGEMEAAIVINGADEEERLHLTDILCLNGTLYALADDALYAYVAGNLIRVSNIAGAKRIAAADGGSAIYALGEDEIAMFDKSGERLPSKLRGDFAEARDIAVDHVGNICLLFENRVETFKNRVSSLQKTSETELISATHNATANSCALAGDTLYFSADECFVGKLKVDAKTKDNYVAPALPTPESGQTYRFVKPKEGGNAFYIPANDGRFDGAVAASGNVLLALDGIGELEDGLCYALDRDKLVIIALEEFEDVEPAALDGKAYLFKTNSAIFEIPYFDNLKIEVASGTQGVTTVSDCAGYDDNGWWLVKYESKIYFADPTALEEDLAPPPVDPPTPDEPTEPEALFGRAKAGRVGGVVNIYSDLAESEVLTRIVDGKKVEILAAYNDYYQVKYGNAVGFMRASEVKIGGLTTVQIVAIVLSALVLIAGAGIFISIATIKKRNDAEAEQNAK